MYHQRRTSRAKPSDTTPICASPLSNRQRQYRPLDSHWGSCWWGVFYLAGKPGFQIRHPAVIDVAVRRFNCHFCGYAAKFFAISSCTVSANRPSGCAMHGSPHRNIPAFLRDITARIGKLHIRRIVNSVLPICCLAPSAMARLVLAGFVPRLVERREILRSNW